MRLARLLGAVGRICITAGVLILLFVAYQLWGTGIRTAQAQNQLEDDFEAVLEEAADTTTSTTTTTEPGDPARPPPSRSCRHRAGPPRARPRLRSRSRRSASTRSWSRACRSPTSRRARATTRRPRCPARRATPPSRATAPPTALRSTASTSCKPGDEITVTTVQGEFTYEVTETHIVSPTQVDVLEDKGDNRLTLSACHPKYSARAAHHRRVAARRGRAAAAPATVADEARPPATALDDIDGEGAPAWPAILLGTPVRPHLAASPGWWGAAGGSGRATSSSSRSSW